MKKGLLILTGDNVAKNLLQEKLKNDWWVWNVSPYNHIRHNSAALGWEFDDTDISDEFIQKFLSLANIHFDYEYNYVVKFMNQIEKSEKAEEHGKNGDILIVHGVNRELIDRLQDDYQFFVVNASMCDRQVKDNFEDSRFKICLGDTEENIYEAINNVMKYVTYDVIKLKEI